MSKSVIGNRQLRGIRFSHFVANATLKRDEVMKRKVIIKFRFSDGPFKPLTESVELVDLYQWSRRQNSSDYLNRKALTHFRPMGRTQKL